MLHVDIDVGSLRIESDVEPADLAAFLHSHCIPPLSVGEAAVTVALEQFTTLHELHDAKVDVAPVLAGLADIVRYPPMQDPVTVTVSGLVLNLTWHDGTQFRSTLLSRRAFPTFVRSGIAFVATDDAWTALHPYLDPASRNGHCRLHPAGFIEVTSPRPQLVERIPIRGLFRLSPTTFGVPFAYRNDVAENAGFSWETTPRHADPVPSLTARSERFFTPHIVQTLPAFVAHLDQVGSRVICWEPGNGSRVFALAALGLLDAVPTLIVTAPKALFSWSRTGELMGRSVSVHSGTADLQLVSYRSPVDRLDAQAVVFDAPTPADAAAVAPLLSGPSMRDVERLVVTTPANWPADPQQLATLMSLLKPAEFDAATALQQRYPGTDSLRRFHEHVDAFIDRRQTTAAVDAGHCQAVNENGDRFKRSTVQPVMLNDAQLETIAANEKRWRALPVSDAFNERLELVSAGPRTALSSKLAAAVVHVRTAAAAGETIAVLTRHPRTASTLAALCRPTDVAVVNETTPPAGPATIVVFDTQLPSLRHVDQVLVIDYPWSFTTLNNAVGAASDPAGPDVTVLHAVDDAETQARALDDQLAVFAAHRAERDENTCRSLTVDEIRFLLDVRL